MQRQARPFPPGCRRATYPHERRVCRAGLESWLGNRKISSSAQQLGKWTAQRARSSSDSRLRKRYRELFRHEIAYTVADSRKWRPSSGFWQPCSRANSGSSYGRWFSPRHGGLRPVCRHQEALHVVVVAIRLLRTSRATVATREGRVPASLLIPLPRQFVLRFGACVNGVGIEGPANLISF